MKPNPQLVKFLAPYDEKIQRMTLEVRDFIIELTPDANELIWDNYNAVAIAFSKSLKLKDAFCHISVYAKHINFGFNRGAELSNTTIALQGKGKLIRHISIEDIASFPEVEVSKLVLEAVQLAENHNKDLKNVKTIPISKVMSISAKKIRPTDK